MTHCTRQNRAAARSLADKAAAGGVNRFDARNTKGNTNDSDGRLMPRWDARPGAELIHLPT